MRRIWDRLNKQNEHFMGVIVGQEGSGKSHTAIKIANLIDPSFTADRVIFDVADLLKVLNEGKHDPGNFYVLDEAGVQLGRRTWQERGQVLANQALQLIRSHNLGLLFTLPRLGELDSQTQGRLQAFIEMTRKENGEYVEAKWKWMDPDRSDSTGKIYKKYPRRRMGYGSKIRVRTVAFTPPDQALVDPYERRKEKFQQEFYEKTIAELSDDDDENDEKERRNSMKASEIADEISGNGVAKVVSTNKQTGKPYVNREKLIEEYDLTFNKARLVKERLEEMHTSEELSGLV